MKASEAGYSHREFSVLTDRVHKALGEIDKLFWLNTDDRACTFTFVLKNDRSISITLPFDTVLPENSNGRPFAVRPDLVKVIKAEYRKAKNA